MLDDPEQLIEQLRRYAGAADSVFVPELGFGIADVATIGLRAVAMQRALRTDRRRFTVPEPDSSLSERGVVGRAVCLPIVCGVQHGSDRGLRLPGRVRRGW
jgi:hypothetical protein